MKIPAGLRELMSTFPFDGKVVWIGVRPAPREPISNEGHRLSVQYSLHPETGRPCLDRTPSAMRRSHLAPER